MHGSPSDRCSNGQMVALPVIGRTRPSYRAHPFIGELLDAETVRGSDVLLWDDDEVIAAALLVSNTSTQRPRRSSSAA